MCEAEWSGGGIKWRLFFFSFFFLIYKQKAPVDLSFLEFHADNDAGRITFRPLWVTGGEMHTNNPTCVNGALARLSRVD